MGSVGGCGLRILHLFFSLCLLISTVSNSAGALRYAFINKLLCFITRSYVYLKAIRE
ncbi:hypothetical protein GLYMA_06G043433v4 [Glycine max]|nr:hypothetical protein GLYMA_06G043433v4 [Glycine max]KAH1124131.1 hypothetical protein GYH30_014052 [Glycine max]